MKNILVKLIVSFIVFTSLMPVPILAQERSFYNWASENYQVYSDESKNRAVEILEKMEGSLKLFNELFHFDLSNLPAKFRVRIFKDKDDFDLYLEENISETRSDFVFISYTDPTLSGLIGFAQEEEEFNTSLLHYGFIQYFNAIIPEAPLWLVEGMATYLEYSTYNPFSQSFHFQPNLIWLAPLKKILKNEDGYPQAIPIAELITIDQATAQEKIDVFYPTSWGLVHFLMSSSDQRFNRVIWDSISALGADLSLAQNSEAVKKRAFSWVKQDELQRQFESFILSLKTFNELVREGVDHYTNGRNEEAAKSFNAASELKSDNYIPYYYLGLTSYNQKDYQQAHRYYTRAMELGIEQQLINYALGVNAFADKRYDLAENYLNSAREMDLETYGEKVDSLLKRIEMLK
ncbi:hypothetical protein ES703_101298 [subsurface metagenome]